jgi:hypothetical protein
MAYPLKPTKTSDGKVQNMLYNTVSSQPAKHSDIDTESRTNKSSKKEMLDFYSSRDPIQDRLNYVPEDEVIEWTLNMYKPLPIGSRAR